MASIVGGSLKLQITPNSTNVDMLDFTVDYDILWTPFEISSNLPYSRRYTVFGVDTAANTGPPPDPATAGEDDRLQVEFFGDVSSGGARFTHVKNTLRVPRTRADEDKPPIPNPDELQVLVELTPQLPRPLSGRTNIVKIDLS
jgi:hypothetical protein